MREAAPISKFLAERFHFLGLELQNWMIVVVVIFVVYGVVLWAIARKARLKNLALSARSPGTSCATSSRSGKHLTEPKARRAVDPSVVQPSDLPVESGGVLDGHRAQYQK
jgi:hypothetical protein